VSVLRLHRLRRQFPVGLVRRLLHRRAVPHNSIPTEAPGAVSSRTCQGRRLQLRRCRLRPLQLRHLDIWRHAALRIPLRQTVLSGARSRLAITLRFGVQR